MASGVEQAAADALSKVATELPGGGEDRPGQVSMARAVAAAIDTGRHLAVQAGTGTGKSLAYLVPAILSGNSVVVATATKALQDQLAGKDLPFLAGCLPEHFTFSVLKGRSNYVCLQKVREVSGRDLSGRDPDSDQLALDGVADVEDAATTVRGHRLVDDLKRLIAWADRTRIGDLAELEFEPDPRAWSALSTTSRECPGASNCPSGSRCLAEAARRRAQDSDVVVTNTHLYGAHLASGGGVLPPHDVVVFDEAHQLEDVAAAALGMEIGGGAFRSLARQMRPLLQGEGKDLADRLTEAGDLFEAAAARVAGQRLAGGLDSDLARAVSVAQERLAASSSTLRSTDVGSGDQQSLGLGGPPVSGPREAAKSRAVQAAAALAGDLVRLAAPGADDVVWVEESERSPVVKMAPVDVRSALAATLWPGVTAILTSATLPIGLVSRLGLQPEAPVDAPASTGSASPGSASPAPAPPAPAPPGSASPGSASPGEVDPAVATFLDVGSPFPYRTNSLLYCPAHLPSPKAAGAETAMHRELIALITASRGRALALFTSWRAMRAAREAVRDRIPFAVYAQGDLPKHQLLRRFSDEESSCLFATMSFWQGVDVPGEALSLVVIDRIPFPRPDEPLMEARRERAGGRAFQVVDIPRAATLLAQGSGRLIRSATDRGVVAVLDSRLATANYRKALLAALPPMKRTVTMAEVEAFFAEPEPTPESDPE